MSINDYSDLYQQAGAKWGVDPALLMAQGQAESGGDPNAEGPPTKYGTARGLAQFIPDTAKRLGITDPTDPAQAINGQAQMMAENIKRYGNTNDALMAYHGGTNKTNWGPKTNAYPGQVMKYYKGNQIASKGTQVASNDPNFAPQTSQDDEDPFVSARKEVEANKAKVSAPATPDNDDPFVTARKEVEANKAKAAAEPPPVEPKPFTSPEGAGATAMDVIESAPTGFVRAVNNLPKLPGAVYTIANQLSAQYKNKMQNLLGYDAQENPAEPLTDAQQTANIRNAGNTPIGNFLNSAPTVSQMAEFGGAAAAKAGGATNLPLSEIWNQVKNGPDQNPLLTNLHEPTTGLGQITEQGFGAIPGGELMGLKPFVAFRGGAGAEAVNQLSPDNPFGQVVGGTAAAAGPSALTSIKYRPAADEVANTIIQENAKGGGPPLGGGGGAIGTFKNLLSDTSSIPPAAAATSPNGVVPNNITNQEIIPGSKPTLAEATGDPNIALLERQVQQQNPAAWKAFEDTREAARENYFEQASGTSADLQAMEAAREAQRVADTANIFKPGQTADPQPVIDKIDSILSGPGGKRDAVVSSLNNIRSKLIGEDGKLTTDPETLYQSVQKQIADLLDKKDLTNSAGKQASRELLQVKEVLDKTIDQATPGYQKYLDNYSSASSKIDAARWMQNLKLTDAAGRYTLAKVQNALTNAEKLQSAPGINEAKNLSPDQMKALTDLRDDLLRRENVMRASMPRGSNTNQNAIATKALNQGLLGKANSLMGGNGLASGGAAAGAAISPLFGLPPWLGGYAGEQAGSKLAASGANRAAAASGSLTNFLLTPENYKSYLMNNIQPGYLERTGNKLVRP